MKISKTSATLAAAFALAMTSSGAMAQPGAKLLTTGSESEPAIMGSGVSFEEKRGVNVFRGKPAAPNVLLGAEPVAAPASIGRDIDIIVKVRPWRSFRRLRTQGFYSGYAYPSRQYTQGFYSGRR